MPWKERSRLEERKDFIRAWERHEESMAELCRRYGVSRVTGYTWIARYQALGESGLEEQSRAPHHSAWAMSEETAQRIIQLRREHPRWGSRKLKAYLEAEDRGQHWPAASSMGALLDREGLIIHRRRSHRTPPFSEPLAHADAPNRVWCADFKGWFRCGDGARCDPLTASDACSRYLLRCRAVEKTDGPHVQGLFEATFREYGLPERIRTDNGPPFASVAPGGLSRLSMWWIRLGIQHERIEPGCPEQNGRHERLHQTLKQETADPPQANLRRQQQAFLRFQREYNEQRPHEALGNRTPASVYVPSPRPFPARMPELVYPDGVLWRRISQQGSLKWKAERTFISEVLARQDVGLLPIEQDLFEVYYGPVLLGWLDGHAHVFIVDRGPSRRRRRTRPPAGASEQEGRK